jgi:hypothetical protein
MESNHSQGAIMEGNIFSWFANQVRKDTEAAEKSKEKQDRRTEDRKSGVTKKGKGWS